MVTPTKITATDLARRLSDVLNRVKYRKERFEVVRNGEVVALLEPTDSKRSFTVADFRREFAGVKIPAGLGKAIEDARKALGGYPDDYGTGN